MPTERSQTQASPPVWLATTLNSRSRTGSDNALSLPANSTAACADSGSRTSGATSQPETSINGRGDFDIRRY